MTRCFLRYIFSSAVLCVAVLAISGCDNSQPKLHVYTWVDYIKPSLIETFEKECGCQVVIDTYDSNEAMYAKLKAGASGYDIIFPSSYILDIMQQQKMLLPLDMALITNYTNIDSRYAPFMGTALENYGIPFVVTYAAIGYRKDKIDTIMPSWGVFGNNKWRGRMTMLNDVRETIGAGLKFLGYSGNSTDPSEIDKAADVIISWKRNLAKFEGEQYKNGIATAEYLVVQGHNGDLMQVIQENDNVGFIHPKEGLLLIVDHVAIPKDAKETALANAFINFLLRPDVAAENMQFTYFLSPNNLAYPMLSEDLRNNIGLFPPQDILEKSEIVVSIGEAIRLYSKAWDKIKTED